MAASIKVIETASRPYTDALHAAAVERYSDAGAQPSGARSPARRLVNPESRIPHAPAGREAHMKAGATVPARPPLVQRDWQGAGLPELARQAEVARKVAAEMGYERGLEPRRNDGGGSASTATLPIRRHSPTTW